MHYSEALKHCILRYVSGSHQYNTNRPDSDLDYRGVFVAPLAKHFELFQSSFVGSGTIKQSLQAAIEAIGNGETHNAIHLVESALQTDRGDLTVGVETVHNPDTNVDEELQELRKFLKLAADCNPNIIEFLYVNELVDIETDVWKKIKAHRDWFLSKKARWTFAGYAHAQLARIRTHRGYLLNPPKEKPKREDFGLPGQTKIAKENQNAIISLPDEWVADGSKEYVRNEKRYATALQEWTSYCKWDKERNPYRKELERKWGFDCYVEETQFLTDSGFKTYDEITAQDRLATFDTTTFKLTYQNFIDRYSGFFTGNLYHLFGNHTGVLVTPNHNLFFRKKERRSGKASEWGLQEAFSLPDTFDILRTITPNTKNYTDKHLFRIPISSYNYLRLMGWYLSDGCMTFRKGQLRGFRISQKSGGKLHWSMSRFYGAHKSKIHVGLYEYERKPNVFNPNTITEVVLVINEKSIAQKMFSDCSNLKEKRIPRYVFSLSKAKKEILLKALIGGDGTTARPDNSMIYYSTLEGLANDVQELAFSCGYETSLYGPYNVENCTMWQVHINKTREQFKTCIRNANIEKLETTNKRIVCFTVPNRTLVTRFNGHIGLHGNSKHAMHLVRLCRMGVEIIRDGVVLVRRPDAEELKGILRGEWKYEDVERVAVETDKQLDTLYATSTLQESPQRKKISELYKEICEQQYGIKLRD